MMHAMSIKVLISLQHSPSQTGTVSASQSPLHPRASKLQRCFGLPDWCSTCKDRGTTPLSAGAHAARRFLTLAADTVTAWSFWWCQPSLFLSKCSMCRKCQPLLMLRALIAVASWPTGLQPVLSKGMMSPQHIHSLFFPGAAYSEYLARVKPSPDAESLLHLEGSNSHARACSRGKSGSVCRDSAVQQLHFLILTCRLQ